MGYISNSNISDGNLHLAVLFVVGKPSVTHLSLNRFKRQTVPSLPLNLLGQEGERIK